MAKPRSRYARPPVLATKTLKTSRYGSLMVKRKRAHAFKKPKGAR